MAAPFSLLELEKDPRLFLYTSLTAGSSHIITATSRMETILKANRIPFQAIDIATDEKARRLWQRRGGTKKLPGLVKEGFVLGDINDVEEWNEFGELKENIGPVPASNVVPAGGLVGINTAPPLSMYTTSSASGTSKLAQPIPEEKSKGIKLPGIDEITALHKKKAEAAAEARAAEKREAEEKKKELEKAKENVKPAETVNGPISALDEPVKVETMTSAPNVKAQSIAIVDAVKPEDSEQTDTDPSDPLAISTEEVAAATKKLPIIGVRVASPTEEAIAEAFVAANSPKSDVETSKLDAQEHKQIPETTGKLEEAAKGITAKDESTGDITQEQLAASAEHSTTSVGD